MRRTFTLCGGSHNPIIVVDDSESASRLVASANVDLLLSVREDSRISQFIEGFKHLPPWSKYEPIFREHAGVKPQPNFLDIISAARSLSTAVRDPATPAGSETLIYKWTDDDPLADVFRVTYGQLPIAGESGSFVAEQLGDVLPITTVNLHAPVALSTQKPGRLTLRTLTDHELEYHLWQSRANAPAGFFIGEADSFWSVVNYWNFRASGWQLLFYDPRFSDRLDGIRDHWATRLGSTEMSQKPGDSVAIVASSTSSEVNASWLPKGITHYPNDPVNSLGEIDIPLSYYPEHRALANVGDSNDSLTAIMPIPAPLFQGDRYDPRNVGLNVQVSWDPSEDDQSTFQTPNLPLLNTYYGQKFYFEYNAARVDRGGLTLLQRHLTGSLSLRALTAGPLIREIFERIGIKAEPSQAGLVTARVISQMGRLDNRRPFRVRGLRTLIEGTRVEGSFTRSHAIQTIREVAEDGSVGFDRYTDLHIEPPPSGLPKPGDIFRYMVSHGAFRVGLEFHCPVCSLDFWISLDHATARPQCEYCGTQFDATPQLRDRDWRYRRSGGFGKDDSQHGAIPVALTLLRFMHMNAGARMLYTTSLTLKPSGVPCRECETDFVALFAAERNSKVQLAIGECKTRKEITEQDVNNLMSIADVLESRGIETFIVISKLQQFSTEECALIARANSRLRQRAIILTEKELESWFPYTWAEAIPGPRYYGSSLEDFAAATAALYLKPAANAGGSA
jgi:hypothetical protein